MVVHNCNPSTAEAEAAGSQVSSQPGIYHETASKKKNSRIYPSFIVEIL
jgi:hypothetical protein